MMHRRQRSGITLIELLVVISIIAVLAGLLLPAVQKIRESAKRAQALTDISQLSNALGAFKDTYKGPYPPTVITLNSSTYNTTTQDWKVLSAIWPRLSPSGVVPNLGTLDGNQSMVFFLGGYAGGARTQGFSAVERNPFGAIAGNAKKGPFFEFRSTQLDAQGRFLDPWGTPYFYMASYKGGDYDIYRNPNLPTTTPPDGSCTINGQTVRPVRDATGKFVMYDTFQIISAGRDKRIGPGGSWTPGQGAYTQGQPGGDDHSNFAKSMIAP